VDWNKGKAVSYLLHTLGGTPGMPWGQVLYCVNVVQVVATCFILWITVLRGDFLCYCYSECSTLHLPQQVAVGSLRILAEGTV